MTEENTLTTEKLLSIMKELEDKDPFLKRGIKRDWVCAVNPRFIPALREFHQKEKMGDSENRIPFIATDWLTHMMGRQAYIINEAPDTHIEYLAPDTARAKYPRYFREADKMMIKGVFETFPDIVMWKYAYFRDDLMTRFTTPPLA